MRSFVKDGLDVETQEMCPEVLWEHPFEVSQLGENVTSPCLGDVFQLFFLGCQIKKVYYN